MFFGCRVPGLRCPLQCLLGIMQVQGSLEKPSQFVALTATFLKA